MFLPELFDLLRKRGNSPETTVQKIGPGIITGELFSRKQAPCVSYALSRGRTTAEMMRLFEECEKQGGPELDSEGSASVLGMRKARRP